MRAGTTNEKGRCAGIFHLIVRILTLPPIVIGITVLLMYAPRKAYDTAGAAAVRVVFAAHSHGCISYTGDISHWKGSEKGTAQHGAGMQCHRIPVRVSLVNADPVLLARPHSLPLLCHFHSSTADSQRRFQAARKRP